jgi:DNA-binding CsgD family transcriptional regulator
MADRQAREDDWILQAYDSAMRAADRTASLAGLERLLGADFFQASLHAPGGAVTPIGIGSDTPDTLKRLYYAGWSRKDPWAQAGLSIPRNVVGLGSELCPDELFVRSELYNELLRPHRVEFRHLLGVVLEVEDQAAVLGFIRTRDRHNFAEPERRRLARLAPHFARSLQLARRLGTLEQISSDAVAALDRLAVAVIVVDEALRPVLANAKAERLMRARDGLSATAFGPLRAERVAESERLAELVRQVVRQAPRHPGGAMLLSRPSGQPAHHVMVAPLVGRTRQLIGDRPGTALVVVLPSGHGAMPGRRMLQDLFGLSAAEADLAERLARGATLEAIAAERHVEVTTLRSQLRAVFQKTATERQAALVGLLTRLAIV